MRVYCLANAKRDADCRKSPRPGVANSLSPPREITRYKKRRGADSRKYFYSLELAYAAKEDAMLGIAFADF
jgi:hypothetical protein